MADSNRVSLKYAPLVTTFDESAIPGAGSLALQQYRFTSESLKRSSEYVQSEEIVDTRAISDFIRTSVGADGDINAELSYGTHDDIFRMWMQDSAWSALVSDTTVSNTTITSGTVAGGGDNPGAGLALGDIVQVCLTISSVKSYHFARITTYTDQNSFVLTPAPPNAAAGQVTKISRGEYLEQGTTMLYTHWEKQYNDFGATNEFEHHLYSTVNNLSLTIPAKGIVTLAASYMSRIAYTADLTMASGTTAVTTTDVVDSVRGVKHIWLDDEVYRLTQFNMGMNNNLRARNVIALEGLESIGSGTAEITGGFQAYYKNTDAYEKFENDQAVNVGVAFRDSDIGATYLTPNAYFLDIPRLKFGSAQRVTGGRNQDVLADLTFNATISKTYTGNQRQIRLYRWAKS